MSTKSPAEPAEPNDQSASAPDEITLRDGESVRFTAPLDGETHIVVNVVPPQRSTGLVGSCLQGCGCLVVAVVILGLIGSVVGR
jgi:hypothetical protein